MEQKKQEKDNQVAYIRRLGRGCFAALAVLTVLMAAYAGYAVLAALIPAEQLSTGLTDTGMKIGLASLPINLGKGLPYWAIPRSGNITSAMNWAWFWNIVLVMLLEILPVWLLTFWLYRAARESAPEYAARRMYQKLKQEGDGPTAVGVIGWDVSEHFFSSRNRNRLWRAGWLTLTLGLLKRTLWLLLLSGLVCGEWDWTWNLDMTEYLPCILGAGMLLISRIGQKDSEDAL